MISLSLHQPPDKMPPSSELHDLLQGRGKLKSIGQALCASAIVRKCTCARAAPRAHAVRT